MIVFAGSFYLFSISFIQCLKEEKLLLKIHGDQIHWNGQHLFIPGHGNWPGEIPEVHRWAYDYGKDGRDFIPQTEPIGESESRH